MEKIIEKITERFGDKVQVEIKTRRRVYVSAAKSASKEIIGYLFKELGARMSIATAIDTRPAIELLYHMAFDRDDLILSLRVLLDKPDPETETITDLIEGAEWIEREIHEMFGVNFIGHPKLERLLLPDDWPEGEHPLLKQSFESEKEGEERPYL